MSKFRAPVNAGLFVIGGLMVPSAVFADACFPGDCGDPTCVLGTPGSINAGDPAKLNAFFGNSSGLIALKARSHTHLHL